MDGDGHFSKPMRPISKSQPASKRTAWPVMFQLSQPTGCTYKVTQSSNRSKQKVSEKPVWRIRHEEHYNEEISVLGNHRRRWADHRRRVHAARETGCCPD